MAQIKIYKSTSAPQAHALTLAEEGAQAPPYFG